MQQSFSNSGPAWIPETNLMLLYAGLMGIINIVQKPFRETIDRRSDQNCAERNNPVLGFAGTIARPHRQP
jgi:hypothetical protein